MEMTTETQFPQPPGSEVSLKCSTGYTLTGDTTVTCKEGRHFLFSSTTDPACQLGLNGYSKIKNEFLCTAKKF